MEDFLEAVDHGLDFLAGSNPDELKTALMAIDVLLQQDERSIDASQFRSRILDVFLLIPTVRHYFYDFLPKIGVRQGMDEPEEVALPLDEQFARLRLIRNKRITKHPVTLDDEVAAYLLPPSSTPIDTLPPTSEESSR